jgi:hypothetical protein
MQQQSTHSMKGCMIPTHIGRVSQAVYGSQRGKISAVTIFLQVYRVIEAICMSNYTEFVFFEHKAIQKIFDRLYITYTYIKCIKSYVWVTECIHQCGSYILVGL